MRPQWGALLAPLQPIQFRRPTGGGFPRQSPKKCDCLIFEQAGSGGLNRLAVKILPRILGWADGRARRIRIGPSGREWRAALCTWDWAWSARRDPSRPWSRRAACWTRDAGQPFGSFPCTFWSNWNGTRPDDDAKVPKNHKFTFFLLFSNEPTAHQKFPTWKYFQNKNLNLEFGIRKY